MEGRLRSSGEPIGSNIFGEIYDWSRGWNERDCHSHAKTVVRKLIHAAAG
jgi:hypothetical protein